MSFDLLVAVILSMMNAIDAPGSPYNVECDRNKAPYIAHYVWMTQKEGKLHTHEALIALIVKTACDTAT